MNWLDIVVLVTVGTVALAGLRLGGVHIAVTAVGVLAGIVLAGHLHGDVRPIISRFTDSENGAEIGAFAAIFVLALIASLVAGFMLRVVLSKLMLGWIDRLAGLGLGVVVTLAAGSAVLSAIQSYPVLGLEETITGSTLGSFLADNFDVVLRGLKFIPDDLGT